MTKDEMLAEYEVDGFFYDLILVSRKDDGTNAVMQSFNNYETGQREYFDFLEI